MSFRIPSASVSHYVYFDAPPGLSGFTVHRQRNGGSVSAMSSPTVSEVDSTNMPGRYSLLVNEDTTIDAANEVEHMQLYVRATSWVGKALDVELFVTNVRYRNGARLFGTGQPADLWRGVE